MAVPGGAAVQYAPSWHAPVPGNDEVRTIFVVGFPPDVKERELHNLLRWWPGFEASQMNFKSDQPVGFALFSSSALALAARDALQNLQFDPESSSSILRVEMAKKNLYVKRGSASDAAIDNSKRLRTAGDYTATSFAPASGFPPVAPTWGPPSFVPSAPMYDAYSGYGVPMVSPSMVLPVAPAGYSPVQNIKDNPPCNTLFVGNLSDQTNEAELRALFSSQPGFQQMKVLRQERSIACFIEFADIVSATAVHNNLQGAVLTSSDRGGVRLQYSKNPFGKRKQLVNAADDDAPGVSELNGGAGRPAHGA